MYTQGVLQSSYNTLIAYSGDKRVENLKYKNVEDTLVFLKL